MAKRQIQHSQKQLNSTSLEAQEVQSVITMDDNILPSPAELDSDTNSFGNHSNNSFSIYFS